MTTMTDDRSQRRVRAGAPTAPGTRPRPGAAGLAVAADEGPPERRRIAVVHDQLYTIGGAEQVLREILQCYPTADLFALFDLLPPDQRSFLAGRRVTTTGLQRLPGLRRFHRHYLPFMPFQIEQLDLRGYDIVISSSYLVAKGVIVGPDQLHVCYVHSPMRYAWDMQFQYLEEMGLERGVAGFVLRRVLHRMRLWDHRSAAGVDEFIANSHFIARRVRKAYRRDAKVIYPPVDTARWEAEVPSSVRDPFFLTVSRLVPYKRVNLLVDAFRRRPEARLIVIGDGPERHRLEASAPSNVSFLGYQPDAVVSDHCRRARAFLYAAEEDFGLVPVEAQAAGAPVVAYGRGGAAETVVDAGRPGATGVLFHEQTPEAILAALDRFERYAHELTPENCRLNARRFAGERFRQEFRAAVEQAYGAFAAGLSQPAGADPGAVRAGAQVAVVEP
jgi:glycosyltransferase involved in cell wall biosynthesis